LLGVPAAGEHELAHAWAQSASEGSIGFAAPDPLRIEPWFPAEFLFLRPARHPLRYEMRAKSKFRFWWVI
jgi:hypothetical protein